MILPLSSLASSDLLLFQNASSPVASSIAGSTSSSGGACTGTAKAARLPHTPSADTQGLDELRVADQRSDAVIQRGIRRTTERASTRRSDSVEIRGDLVARVRAQIAAGEYDSPAKIEEAANQLAGHLDLLA